MQTVTGQPDPNDNDVGMIKDFIAHVRGIIPLLENVKSSIEESTGRLPKASKQLSDVTSATESATVEILNVLEGMTVEIEATERELSVVRQFVERANRSPEEEGVLTSIGRIERMLAETKENSMNIAIALQVQDITSQQIAGVSYTIESIRLALGKALKRFDEPEGTPPDDSKDAGKGKAENTSTHFDGDAKFSTTPDRQDVADEIIKQWNDKSPT